MPRFLSSVEMTDRGHGSRTTHWRRSRNLNDPFPAPYQLSANRKGWDLEEVETYEANLIRLGPLKAPAKAALET